MELEHESEAFDAHIITLCKAVCSLLALQVSTDLIMCILSVLIITTETKTGLFCFERQCQIVRKEKIQDFLSKVINSSD